MLSFSLSLLRVVLPAMLVGCAGTQVSSLMPERRVPGTAVHTRPASTPSSKPPTSGELSGYLAYALQNSPETRAAFEQWRAARYRISLATRLPEPNISFGYYLRSVETRVGPQRYKIGVTQTFPWPEKLTAGEDAASEQAKAAALVVDTTALEIARKVANAYWALWLINEEYRLMSGHDLVLETLTGAVRGRLQTGTASLADLNQVTLNIARHHDHQGKHQEAARKASALLREAMGAQVRGEVLVPSDSPDSGLPKLSEEKLAEMSSLHPHIERFSHLAASATHRARSQRADRFPRFSVGLGLIGTGEAASSVADSGKDALIISAGLSVPLWAGSYSDAQQAELAIANSKEAMAEASRRGAEAMLVATLSDTRDAQRRIDLYRNTLLPQAETTLQAVLGGYQIGNSTVAAVILAQRDLVELQLEHAGARVDRATSWATLEYLVGARLEVETTQ